MHEKQSISFITVTFFCLFLRIMSDIAMYIPTYFHLLLTTTLVFYSMSGVNKAHSFAITGIDNFLENKS